MLYRTWAFVAALFLLINAFASLFPKSQEPLVHADFETLLRTGKAPGKRIVVDGGALADSIVYTYKPKNSKVKDVSFFLVSDMPPADKAQPPEVAAIITVPVPTDVTEKELDALLPSLMPTTVEGCVGQTEDADKLKRILESGYRVKSPLMTISQCAAPASEGGSPWGFLALPVVLFGLYRFLRLFRLAYLERRQAMEDVDENFIPSEISVKETLRTAKAGFGRWQLLRESFFDAAAVYVPLLALYRFKEALPRDLARVSGGAIRQCLQARREGRVGEHLRQVFAQRHVIASNLLALAMMLAGFTSVFSEHDDSSLALLPGLVAVWLMYFKYLGLTKRKAFYATLASAFAAFALLSAIPDNIVKEGILLKLPFTDGEAAVIHPDLLSLPWAAVYAPLCYLLLVYLNRAIARYFSGGIEVTYGGRQVVFADEESKEH
jgi:hypothetical protein